MSLKLPFILCDQTTVNFTPMTFCGPIAGISPPIKCCTCLAYGVSLKDRYVAKKHWGSSCKKAASSTLAPSERVEECWEQHSFLQGRDPAYVMVPHNLLNNPVPLQPSLPGPSESPAEHTRYLMDWTWNFEENPYLIGEIWNSHHRSWYGKINDGGCNED